MASLIFFLRASLRQTMTHKLASVGKDKDEWKKAYDHLTTIMELRSRDKIQRLNLRHSRRLPRLKTLKSSRGLGRRILGSVEDSKLSTIKQHTLSRYRPSCVTIHWVPNIRAMASQLKRNLSQCALFAANGGTMLCIVGTNWTRTKPRQHGRACSTWPRLARRRRRTCPSASRLAKKQRLTRLHHHFCF